MSKYQFKLNGKVVSAKELYEHNLVDYYIDNVHKAEIVLGGLLQGEVIVLYSFTSNNSVDMLELAEVKWRMEFSLRRKRENERRFCSPKDD